MITAKMLLDANFTEEQGVYRQNIMAGHMPYLKEHVDSLNIQADNNVQVEVSLNSNSIVIAIPDVSYEKRYALEEDAGIQMVHDVWISLYRYDKAMLNPMVME